MKYLLLFSLSGLAILPANDQSITENNNQPLTKVQSKNNFDLSAINFNADPGSGRIPAAEFKAQKYCRAEVENFDFDAHFSIIGATVYFSGANFKSVTKGFLTSSSLDPVRTLMDQCIPGSVVVFDDIKVIGPDKAVRKIRSVSYILY